MFASPAVEKLAAGSCGRLGTLAVLLAIAAALVFGVWLCSCGPGLLRALREAGRCRIVAAVLLVLLLAVLVALLLAVVRCRAQQAATRARTAATYSLPAAVLALLYTVYRCCGARGAGVLWDHCGRLLALAFALAMLALWLYLLKLRFCRKDEGDAAACKRVPIYLALALTLAIVLIGVVRRCCDEMSTKDYDLAMVGIWWDGQLPGESGAHLRWAFRDGLTFPDGGFDLYRRQSSGGTWAVINGAPIRPADVWSDATPPGPMWQHRAVDRLHPSRQAHFAGDPWNDLHAMLGYPPYSTLYFVQDPDDPALPAPASPYTSSAALDTYLTAYRAAGTDAHPAVPLAEWQAVPMTMLQIAALQPEIARLLGLLYIDTTADPTVEYDYRVVGHWADGDRSYTVSHLSRSNTAPLAPTVLQAATTPVPYAMPSGPVTNDRAVGLRWDPPTTSPTVALTAADGIVPVRYLPRRRDLGARPCPASATPDPSYVAITRASGDAVEPVAVTPRDDSGVLSWPAWFFTDHDVDYRCYGYAVTGIDVFGRESPMSNALVADVVDRTGPPPPPNVEAVVYQRADTATLATLTQAERDALFPPASTNATAMRISWVWPDAFLTSVPDAKEFRVLAKIAGYATFAQPGNRALWADAASWDATPAIVPLAAAQPLPPRLVAAGVTDAHYYETIWFDPPLAADDDTPVAYGWIGVAGVDRDPFNNAGAVSPPTVVFARDLIPPPAPGVPSLANGPVATDRGSNATLALSVEADGRYTYELLRVPGRRLAGLPAPTGTPPACLAPAAPTCTPGTSACDEERRVFAVRWLAALHPDLFGTATLAPGKPQPSGAGFVFQAPDTVDATIGDDYVYAARAFDRAGNASALGCPQLVRIRDSMPPRAPVVSKALGTEGAIQLAWLANTEIDLAKYRLYRSSDPANDGSLDRMTLVLETSPDGTALGPPGAADATRTGAGTAYVTLAWTDHTAKPSRDTRYRLVAIDSSGNVSALSGSAGARAVDTTPPGPPTWDASPVVRGADADGPFVRLRFASPAGDADARFRIQRQVTGIPAWMPISDWLDPTTTSFVDRRVTAGGGYTYRIQAMDTAGNVGNFSSPRPAP